MILTKKQTVAIDYLEDDITQELLYGGAAGGAKSALGSYWQLKRRFKYPGSRGFICRAVFKTLKDTTLKTFFEVAKMQADLKRGVHFDLTGAHDKENPNCIMFFNGSMIYLRDLADSPQDPDFDELGSLELTDAFIDECGQVSQKGKDTLVTRIRFVSFCHLCGQKINGSTVIEYNNDEKPIKWLCGHCSGETPGLKPKALFATNPVKTWPYQEFYKPTREDKMPTYRKFVQSFVTDNPHAPAAYVELLDRMPEGPQKQRLRYGNWEYDDDPSALIEYDKILDCFTNDFESLKGEKAITADIARLGSDKIVVGEWEGWRVKVKAYEKQRLNETHADIDTLRKQKSIPLSRIVVDEDGVGGGIVDYLGCHGFVNNSRALPNPITLEDENYRSLKDQCYFRLADRINKGGLYIECIDPEIQQLIIEELEWVKQYEMDKDGKKRVLPKDKIKEAIGRSPDFADMLMMREWFEIGFQFAQVGGEL
jgi:phage terminase large subunit